MTLKAEFANQDAALWPGEFVNAHLELNVVKNGVTVPVNAVLMGPTGSFVYLIEPDSTVKAQPVTTADVESGTALIGKGLKVGDKVVDTGQTGLSPVSKWPSSRKVWAKWTRASRRSGRKASAAPA